MWFILKVLLSAVCGSTFCYHQTYKVSTNHTPLSKIAINEDHGILYVGGKNIFLQLNFNLQEIQRQIIGPVSDSKNCKPFDTACRDFVTTDNYISILKLYNNSFLIVCGTAHQGLCFKYNPLNITQNLHFEVTVDPNRDNLYRNFLGSSKSSVMLITKNRKGYDVFYVGQSYDGRNLEYFYKEFASLDLPRAELRFDHETAQSFLSVCNSKKNSHNIKFLYIFESNDYIFHVFLRSANVSESNPTYDTRISRLCKNELNYSSYEEMTISCQSSTCCTTYNIGLSANFYNMTLYMSFGIADPLNNGFHLDDKRGSAICLYNIDAINRRFDSDVLTACVEGKLYSPSWQCDIKACPTIDEQVHACKPTNIYGIESNGTGILKKSVFDISNEMMTSVLPLHYNPEHVVIAGSSTGFVRKIQLLNDKGRQFTIVDVSSNRSIPVSSEMVLDKDKNLYVLTGNTVTKLSMTSCKLHQNCGDCVSSQDPLRCGWCFDHCSTLRECNHTVWHNQSCPPFIYSINPNNGPLEGSTRLIITGENFGTNVANASVDINNVKCAIQTINDSSIFCLTGMTQIAVSAAVKIMVSDPYSKHFKIAGISEQSDFSYEYMISTVKSFFPFKGPISGNTTVTITGDNLHIGSSLSVTIGQVPCEIVRKSRTHIFCRTTSCKECPHIDGTYCEYTGELKVTLDGGISPQNMSFCYMHDPEIDNKQTGYSTILSGGLNLIIRGRYLESVTNHNLKTDLQGKSITTTCYVNDTCSILVCPSPDLRSFIDVNAESYSLTGQISVLLDNNIFYTTDITVNPDPELYYFDKNSQVKDIHFSEKILELQGKWLNSSLKKEDITLLINYTLCPVVELRDSCLRCDLSKLVNITDVSLPVTVSAGNWQRALGHIMFVHRYAASYTSRIPSIEAGVIFGVFVIMILCLAVIIRKKNLGCFKKENFEFSVAFRNTPEEEDFLPSIDIDDEHVSQQTTRYICGDRVKPLQTVEGASNDSLTTAFDGVEITDILKRQNIFIERDRVRLGQDIGHGNFGCVYKGFLLSEEGQEILVAVKTILKTGTESVNAFLDEAIIMKDFRHPNVLSLIGISVAQGEFPLVILPFMSNGDLLSYVRNAEKKPTVKHLVSSGLDVAKGMEYLGTIKFVHRDLAARNFPVMLDYGSFLEPLKTRTYELRRYCLVRVLSDLRLDEDLKVKVADFGLARDIYTKNYYSSDNKKMLPVKWMAPESLKNGTYSTQSDVWSFGVLLWELMTRGGTPYSDVDNWDMLNYLELGRRLRRPDFCPPPLYDIMLRCWEFEPDNRLSFSYINQRLTQLVE